jgi:hypothetical protein
VEVFHYAEVGREFAGAEEEPGVEDRAEVRKHPGHAWEHGHVSDGNGGVGASCLGLPYDGSHEGDGIFACFHRISPFDKFGRVISEDDVGEGQIVGGLVECSRSAADFEFEIDDPDSSFSVARGVHGCELDEGSQMFFKSG